MMGQNVDDGTAAAWSFVSVPVPLAAFEERVIAVANILLDKHPVALEATGDAVRRVGTMTCDEAEDDLIRAPETADSDDKQGRGAGIRRFVDEKRRKPGLGADDVGDRKA